MKRGIVVDETMYAWLFLALLVLVFGIAYVSFGGSSGILNKIKVFIPGFGVANETKYDSQVIAYGLNDGEFYGYNGADLTRIPAEHVFNLENDQVAYSTLGKFFHDYYYGRVPVSGDAFTRIDLSILSRDKDFDFSTPSDLEGIILQFVWREGKANSYVVMRARSASNNVIVGDFYLFLDGTLKFNKDGTDVYSVIKSSDSLAHKEIYETVVPAMIAWRDSILQNGKCEKYISISGKNYIVRGVDRQYLVVDLGKPVIGQDKYAQTMNCTVVS